MGMLNSSADACQVARLIRQRFVQKRWGNCRRASNRDFEHKPVIGLEFWWIVV